MENEKWLINANMLVKDLELLAKYEDSFRQSVILGVVHTVKKQPIVDAVEVVHGRWKDKQTNSIFTWYLECSVCGSDYNTSVGYNYCPNCGAKMDGGNDNG